MAKLKKYFLVCILVAVSFLVFTSYRLIGSVSVHSKQQDSNLHNVQQHPHLNIINKHSVKPIKPMIKENEPEPNGLHTAEQSITEHEKSNHRESEPIEHELEPEAKHKTRTISGYNVVTPKLNEGSTTAPSDHHEKSPAQDSPNANKEAGNDNKTDDKRTHNVMTKLTNSRKPLSQDDFSGAIELNRTSDVENTHVVEINNVTNIHQPADKMIVPENKTRYSSHASNVVPGVVNITIETSAIEHDVNSVSKKIKTKVKENHKDIDVTNKETNPAVPDFSKQVEVLYDNPDSVTDDYESDVPNLENDLSETLKLVYDEPEFEYAKVGKHQANYENLFRRFPNYQSESKMLVYRCRRACGGWADRLKGIIQVYMLSILSKRRFAIEMKEPSDINNFLQPNLLNWQLTEEEKEGVTLGHVDNKRIHDAIAAQYERFDYDPINLFKQDIVYVIANQDWTRSLRKLSITPLRFPDIYKFSSNDLTRIIYHGLFKSSDKLQTMEDEFFQSIIAGKKLACLHARMGDDAKDEYVRYNFSEIMTPLQFLKDHFSEVDYKIVVATDNNEVRNFSRTFFPNFVDTSYTGPVLHIDHITNTTVNQDIKDSAFMRCLLDHMIMSRCDSLILTSSGFGVTAALLRHTSRGLYVFMLQRGFGIHRVIPVRRETIREMFQYNCLTQLTGASYICDG